MQMQCNVKPSYSLHFVHNFQSLKRSALYLPDKLVRYDTIRHSIFLIDSVDELCSLAKVSDIKS